MKTSSANQLELDYDFGQTGSQDTQFREASVARPVNRPAGHAGTDSTHFSEPNFDTKSGAYIASTKIASRLAGRINASSISQLEINDFLAERQRLLDRKFSGTMTPEEENRLEYVRWTLDRIEDARHGDNLDAIEGIIERYEYLARQIAKFEEQLQKAGAGKK